MLNAHMAQEGGCQGLNLALPECMQGLARKLNQATPPMVGKMEYVMHARVPIIKLEHISGRPSFFCAIPTSHHDAAQLDWDNSAPELTSRHFFYSVKRACGIG